MQEVLKFGLMNHVLSAVSLLNVAKATISVWYDFYGTHYVSYKSHAEICSFLRYICKFNPNVGDTFLSVCASHHGQMNRTDEHVQSVQKVVNEERPRCCRIHSLQPRGDNRNGDDFSSRSSAHDSICKNHNPFQMRDTLANQMWLQYLQK